MRSQYIAVRGCPRFVTRPRRNAVLDHPGANIRWPEFGFLPDLSVRPARFVRFLFQKPRQLKTATVGLPSPLPNLIGFLITVVRPVVVTFGFPLLGHSWQCKENVNIEPADFLEARSLGRFSLNKLRSEQGQGVGEYAIMLAVILVVLMGVIHLIGANANNIFSPVGSAIQ
jgi:Flp pilus assembly pilin Flp